MHGPMTGPWLRSKLGVLDTGVWQAPSAWHPVETNATAGKMDCFRVINSTRSTRAVFRTPCEKPACCMRHAIVVMITLTHWHSDMVTTIGQHLHRSGLMDPLARTHGACEWCSIWLSMPPANMTTVVPNAWPNKQAACMYNSRTQTHTYVCTITL